jgi:hypothetical protein
MVTVDAEAAGSDWKCRVVIDHRGEHTEHSVTVSQDDAKRWGRGSAKEDVEDLVRRSFDFLLERESPSSILRSFDLPVIERYFPEYDRVMRKQKPA